MVYDWLLTIIFVFRRAKLKTKIENLESEIQALKFQIEVDEIAAKQVKQEREDEAKKKAAKAWDDKYWRKQQEERTTATLKAAAKEEASAKREREQWAERDNIEEQKRLDACRISVERDEIESLKLQRYDFEIADLPSSYFPATQCH